MRKVPYLQWENIFLDTTIVFSYIQATRSNNTDPRCDFVKRVIDDLSSNKSTTGKKRNFYISAVSISEMYDKSTDQKKTERIVSSMKIGTMTYVSFDTDIAEFMTSNYHPVLGTTKQTAIAKQFGFKDHEIVMAREWITKDLMIIASSDYLQCDAVLTLDERTFAPLCKEVNCFCCVTLEQKFNLSPQYIFEYNG
ncbi:MAG TPA: hypothetical protein PKC39_15180 [Ferruginibacter sp.]|nr:hypothetical protein [Ferruginibacter sp.]HMP22301.1 hypothetical protein [Ferruginibacter sp.]